MSKPVRFCVDWKDTSELPVILPYVAEKLRAWEGAPLTTTEVIQLLLETRLAARMLLLVADILRGMAATDGVPVSRSPIEQALQGELTLSPAKQVVDGI